MLHAVIPDRVAGRPDFLEVARTLRGTFRELLALHLRLRELPARRQHLLARRLRREAEHFGGWCVVNGRVDVALTAGAQAVQLGAGAVGLAAARRILGQGVPLGRSVHGVEEARAAEEGGANYLLLGTIYATPSHPDRPGAGPGLVARCVRRVGLPVVAIGGIDAGRAGQVRRVGAAGAAVVRAIWDAPDPVAAAGTLLESMEAGTDPGNRDA